MKEASTVRNSERWQARTGVTGRPDCTRLSLDLWKAVFIVQVVCQCAGFSLSSELEAVSARRRAFTTTHSVMHIQS